MKCSEGTEVSDKSKDRLHDPCIVACNLESRNLPFNVVDISLHAEHTFISWLELRETAASRQREQGCGIHPTPARKLIHALHAHFYLARRG